MQKDTILLLGDCSDGIRRTVSTIEELLPQIRDHTLRGKLRESGRQYGLLLEQSDRLLRQQGQPEKMSGAALRGAAWLKANARMAIRRDDMTAAYVIAEECDRQVKELCRSRNRYVGAEAPAVDLTGQIIACQEKLSVSLRPFL